ncbi:MAG: hypothetical protein GY806_00910 [Gammaproteobacteria bacterium]|nr:hypothetical protein [Gammaproteobacteria bacterium]
MKKRHFVLIIILILIGLFLAFSAAAHPYNSPLTFRKHMTDDGRIIWSNIPKACFSKGLLICERLHPIYGNSDSSKMDIIAGSGRVPELDEVSKTLTTEEIETFSDELTDATTDSKSNESQKVGIEERRISTETKLKK